MATHFNTAEDMTRDHENSPKCGGAEICAQPDIQKRIDSMRSSESSVEALETFSKAAIIKFLNRDRI